MVPFNRQNFLKPLIISAFSDTTIRCRIIVWGYRIDNCQLFFIFEYEQFHPLI